MEIKEAMKLARTIAGLSAVEEQSVMAVVCEIRAARSTTPVTVAKKRGPKAKQAAAAAPADRPKRKYTKRAKAAENTSAAIAAATAPVQH